MKYENVALIVATLLFLGACSTGAWYEGMKLGADSECRKLPPGADQDCLSRLNKKSYDAYEKERSAK